MAAWGRGASDGAGRPKPSSTMALLGGAASLILYLAIVFAWSRLPVQPDWFQETLYSAIALGLALSVLAPVNFVGFVAALRGLQAGVESRWAHFLALLLNGLFPGAIILLVYYLNRSDLIRHLPGFSA